VAETVRKCPSGALQFYPNPDADPAAAEQLARHVLLNDLALLLAESGPRASRAGAICETIARARGYDYVGLYDVLPGEIAVVGWSGNTPPANPSLGRDRGLSGAAVRSEQTQIVNDVTEDSRYVTTSAATRAEMVVPVVEPTTGDVVGTIDAASNRRNAFGNGDRELVEACGRVILTFWTERG
jgi:GAF domain-containing protein